MPIMSFNLHQLFKSIVVLFSVFKTAFLPQGYPDSVSKDYLEYQIWDTSQAFCSSITGTLATQAMLKGYGVGDDKATILAATITWLLRNGSGMVGSILFAWMQGSNLDCYAKKWRLFADILNDASIFVELLSPYFKPYFIFFACISSIAKSVVGVAGGATRAALTQHQARRDNMADVAAKDGSQETLVNLLALLAGLVITPLVSGNIILTWTLFFIFTFLHLYFNFRAVSSVVMETLNITRLHILVQDYLLNDRILTPDEVAKREPVLFGSSIGECLEIRLGTQFGNVIHNVQDFESALPNSPSCTYIMRVDLNNSCTSGTANIVLHESSDVLDHIKSCFHAAVVDFILRNNSLNKELASQKPGCQALLALHSFWWQERNSSTSCCWDLVAQSHNFTIQAFPEFLDNLQKAGWLTSQNHLGPNEWRSVWNTKGVEIKKMI
ncbi:RUS1 family protein C16orf58-like [Exaiptasia diaphana]|nr:RUS1 family protein C16orf58-like [Exaiptasia diaphana]